VKMFSNPDGGHLAARLNIMRGEHSHYRPSHWSVVMCLLN